ncbi:MAG: TlpA family protein disulfide reductase [Bacteroidales bacterium]|nr:TlpA family protein disulfide reductase [Bacteroidales bacterium]
MKRIFFPLFAVLLSAILFSCSKQTVVEIEIAELSSGKAYIVYADPDEISSRQQEDLAEGEIKDGKIRFDLSDAGFKNKTKDCTLSIINEEKRFRTNIPLPVEKGKKIRLVITDTEEYSSGKSPLKITYSGSKQAEKFSQFWNEMNSVLLSMSRNGGNKKDYEKTVSLCKDFTLAYPQSAFPFTVLIGLLNITEEGNNPIMEYCEELSNQKSENVWQNYLVSRYKDLILRNAMAKHLSFAAQDKKGNNYSESNFEGKLTLVHFWSVQSPKCLEVLNDVKNIYKQYHSDGLEIVSISIDPQPNLWIKWSETNFLPWLSLIADGQVMTQKYNFNDIPLYMLFSKEGKLIQKSNIINDLKQSITDNL